MKLRFSILTLFSSLLIVSCSSGSAEVAVKQADKAMDELITETPTKLGEELMNNKCMICHKLAPTHDELLAPPMRGVQMNYKSKFSTKEEFMVAVVNWASGPDSTKSVMTGALDQFGLMPYLSYPKDELYLIAEYIYDADLPRPGWAGQGGMHGTEKAKGMGKNKKN